jgi:MFS transporter, PAT family, beta-lactamase induction signal transducer AmpG
VPSIASFLKVFQSRKMIALLLIGFSSGLPLFLTSKMLQAWMTAEKVDLTAIGLFSLVGLPYSLKFIWSPLLDRFRLPFLGRRRGWLLALQIALLFAIAGMSIQQPQTALFWLAVNALVIAFLSATQDIVADAYRTDILSELEMGAGAAVFVLGYRISLLLSGALAFILADSISWPNTYLLMAGCVGIGMIGTLIAPEPKFTHAPESLSAAVIFPFRDFFLRQGLIQALLILIFIVLYKLGDAIVNNMSTPFLLQTGFSQTDIGAIQGGMGLVATIVGTLLGGALLSQWGINRALWIFGGLQAVSNLVYLLLSQVGKNYSVLVLAINVENFCAGLGTAAFVAFMMRLCNQQFSATQFALLSSFMAFSRDILVAPAGAIAKSVGWPLFFGLSILAALPGLCLLPVFAPWNAKTVPSVPRPGISDDL